MVAMAAACQRTSTGTLTEDEPGLCLDEDIPDPPQVQTPTPGEDVTVWAREVKEWADTITTQLKGQVVCNACGSLVMDQQAHTDWHNLIAATFGSLRAS